MAVVYPYVKQTWTDGVSSCSAARNSVHEDGIFNAHNMPSVRVYHNATQAITTATETALAFNTERWDTAGGAASTMHDTATNNSRLTAQYAGKYLVEGHVEWTLEATGNRAAWVRINATAGQYIGQERKVGSASIFVSLNVHTVVDLAVTDYVQLFVVHDGGANRTVGASTANDQSKCEFMMTRIA